MQLSIWSALFHTHVDEKVIKDSEMKFVTLHEQLEPEKHSLTSEKMITTENGAVQMIPDTITLF